MFFTHLNRYSVGTLIFLISNVAVMAQGEMSFKSILELPWHDTETIPAEEIVKVCSEILTNRNKHSPKTIAEALARRGNAYGRLEKLDEGLKDFEALCELKPKAAKPRSLRAAMLAAMGRLEEGLADAKEAVALEPTLAMPHHILGNVFLMEGKLDDATACAKAAIELDGTLSLAYYLRAMIAEKEGNLKESLALVNRYLEQRPLPDLAQPEHPYRFRGWLMLRLNRPADALNNFLLARKLHPSSAMTAREIYVTYQDLRKWHMAAKAADLLVIVGPNIADNHLTRAYAQAKIGAIQESQNALDQASFVAPPSFSAEESANWGKVNFLLGKNASALECFDNALKLDKDYGPAISGKALMLAACPEAKYRNGAESLKLAKRYHQQGKRKWGAETYSHFLLMADAEAECGNFTEALRLIRKTIELAGCDRELGEFHERIKLFENKKAYRYIVPTK